MSRFTDSLKNDMTELKKSFTGKDKEKNLFNVCIFLLGIIFFGVITFFLLSFFPQITAWLIKKGFQEIFSPSLNLSYFVVALFLILSFYIYICIFFFLVLLMIELSKQDVRCHFKNYALKSIEGAKEKMKKYYFIVLTITLSIIMIYTGFFFLSSAFPNETLFSDGVFSNNESHLKCPQKTYQNIIAGWDLPCEITLSPHFQNKSIKYAEMIYSINRTDFSMTISSPSKERITLYYDKQKEPYLVRIIFTDNSEEIFIINPKGVFTEEEYQNREREKVTWFFAIISFSLFSVFSAMNSLRQIWKNS